MAFSTTAVISKNEMRLFKNAQTAISLAAFKIQGRFPAFSKAIFAKVRFLKVFTSGSSKVIVSNLLQSIRGLLLATLKGNASALDNAQLIPKENLLSAEDSLKNLEFLKTNLLKSLNNLESSKENSEVSSSVYKNIRKQVLKRDINVNDLNKLHQQLAVEHLLHSGKSIASSYLVQMYNPWDTLNRFYIPTSAVTSLKYDYYLPENGVQYGSFVLVNTSTETKSFKFKINNISSFTGVELFNIPFVPSINYQEVADPLVPIKGSISIPPGNTEMIIFKLLGLRQGVSKINITINSSGKITNADINAQVFKIPGNNKDEGLNANVWAYFSRPMIIGRKEEAAADLEQHHINTIVIPPEVLPMLQTSDYSGFANYLSNFKKVNNFLLFMNYASISFRNGYQGGEFLSDQWKSKFKEWYNKITGYIRQNGFPNSEVFLYPYDEISEKNIQDFKNLIIWAKDAIPSIKFYATLANDEAISSILPLIDVAQIQSNYKGLNNLPAHRCDIWIYSGSAPARALSPYSFYRLMSWEAFANKFKGIGFWNYADEGINKNLNEITDALMYPSNSYSAIYDGPDKQIISSRRWEAFRLGIEDYSILQAYAQKFGINKAKALANKVLSVPTDVNKADVIRDQMIVALTLIR